MAKLPPSQWAKLWIKHGGKRSKTAEAVATIMCESGGDTDATSEVGARGAWQFMPETLPSERCARDPDCSTREAVKLSNRGEDFSAWDCHPDSIARSGASTGDAQYASFLEEFQETLSDPTGKLGELGVGLLEDGAGKVADLGIPGVSDLASALQNIAAFFRGAGELLLTPEGWLRLGKLFGGAILLLWGLRIVIRESTGSDPVKAAKNTAVKTAEAAAVVATVK